MTNTEWKDGFASYLEFGLKLWCNVTGNLIAGPGKSSSELDWNSFDLVLNIIKLEH